jgi:hypothetical protein
MHPDGGDAFEKELSLTRTISPNHKLPKDLRRDLPREFQGNYIDERHFIDSWGDRATDGIVYGDGTPKDGYWLVRALYRGTNEVESVKCKVESCSPAPKQESSELLYSSINFINLRVGRKEGMCQAIQTMGGKKPYARADYILAPEVLGISTNAANSFEYHVRYALKDDPQCCIEGTIVLGRDGEGKMVVDYDLAPNDACAERAKFVELGLTVMAIDDGDMPKGDRVDRVDWVGDGPLTGVPGKSKMNSFGKWAMHKDDYRFSGNRTNVKWAMAGRNKGGTLLRQGYGGQAGNGFVLESGTGNVSFENVEGHVLLTENMAVAGYGGKASGPSGLKSPKDIKMKGSFKVYNASPEPIDADVVPDLTYTHHYGF